nr:hypothetical protein [Candidatus Sigynarchaeum springense]
MHDESPTISDISEISCLSKYKLVTSLLGMNGNEKENLRASIFFPWT